ncbi:MAG: hypothetical protein OEW17_04975 [Gemmatimonadota bacterium]|nr:hypothetical protein [Gemmatimonadota bacterium]MDH4348136.1 hypothetical protein [Gemmatimonadota bacterium]
MMSRAPLALAALLVSLAPATAGAQASTADADAREIQAYRLTMPKLKQLNQAMAELRKLEEADPAHQALQKKYKELATLSEKEEPTAADQERMAQLEDEIQRADTDEDDEDNAQSLSDLAARMAADPRIAGALKRAGLAPREAATMQLAFLQVAFAMAFYESETIKEIPKDVNPENVKFYQANKAELATLTALGDQAMEE